MTGSLVGDPLPSALAPQPLWNELARSSSGVLRSASLACRLLMDTKEKGLRQSKMRKDALKIKFYKEHVRKENSKSLTLGVEGHGLLQPLVFRLLLSPALLRRLAILLQPILVRGDHFALAGLSIVVRIERRIER